MTGIKEQVDKILNLAKAHLAEGEMADSAGVCYADACNLMHSDNPSVSMIYAGKRALESLAYSVGVFHSDYQNADKILKELGGSKMANEKTEKAKFFEWLKGVIKEQFDHENFLENAWDDAVERDACGMSFELGACYNTCNRPLLYRLS